MAYTYDDFKSAATKAGLYDTFSKADLDLASRNPDAGMSILKYKQDYMAATTDEARALANAGAEGIRSSYGGYTGGGDGGSFRLDPLSPRSFTYDPAPTYQNQYQGRIDTLTNTLLNRAPFSYNPETDPLYGSYRKTYKREGDRATAQALGEAAAATGGHPSSHAVSAAAQAGNYYAAQMADKVPELEQLAYNKYLNAFNMDQSKLDVLRALEQSDYAKYQDQMNQHNTDRNFAYGQHIDEVSSQEARREKELEEAVLAAEYGDYRGLEDRGIDVTGGNTYSYTLAESLIGNMQAQGSSAAEVVAALNEARASGLLTEEEYARLIRRYGLTAAV